jgi:hypothetical protein
MEIMNVFAKPVVSWKQPEAFRLSEDKHSAVSTNRWLRPAGLLAIVAMYTLAWEILKLNPSKHPPDFVVAFPIILALGVGLVYGYPWLLRRAPAAVSLYSFGIMAMGERSIRSLKTLSGYNWMEEGTFYVLRLTDKKGRKRLYGVPDPITKGKIDVTLRQSGLKESSR